MRLIDADELIADMRHDYNTFPSAPQYGVLVSEYGVSMKQIENAPTIEPKRGEWIDYSCGSGCYCSNCEWDGDDTIDECIIQDFIFCPNCGASMREREGK